LEKLTQSVLSSNILHPHLGAHFSTQMGGGKWTEEGKEVVLRIREVLEAILRLGLEKNSDDQVSSSVPFDES
jgi:hypothetical protein